MVLRPAQIVRRVMTIAVGEPDCADFGKESIDDAIDVLECKVNELRREKARAQMVICNMTDGIITLDYDGRVTFYNPATEILFPGKCNGLLGQKLKDVDLHPELARKAAECISEGDAFDSEIRLPGLPERVVGIRAVAFQNPITGGDLATLILHDLSEARRHEKSQKEFVSNVSHELRTPITSVRVTAEALLNGAKNDEQLVDKFLGNIISESDRLSALIDDLMEIVRRDSGIVLTEKSEVSVFDILRRVEALVKHQAEKDGISLIVSAPDNLMLCCDEIQIEQLVRNLVDNAIKYSSRGGSVSVEARSSGNRILICVNDTGIGIPQSEVGRIFERFYRVDKARSRRLGGTGLGLAIVKDIAKAHGGDILVDTQLGKGSTFTVSLPGADYMSVD